MLAQYMIDHCVRDWDKADQQIQSPSKALREWIGTNGPIERSDLRNDPDALLRLELHRRAIDRRKQRERLNRDEAFDRYRLNKMARAKRNTFSIGTLLLRCAELTRVEAGDALQEDDIAGKYDNY